MKIHRTANYAVVWVIGFPLFNTIEELMTLTAYKAVAVFITKLIRRFSILIMCRCCLDDVKVWE